MLAVLKNPKIEVTPVRASAKESVEAALAELQSPIRQAGTALRTEQAQLEASIQDLHQRGARIELNTCGPTKRLCVLVDAYSGRALCEGQVRSKTGRSAGSVVTARHVRSSNGLRVSITP